MLDLARIGPGQRVLIVGTGTGEDALEAAARVGRSGEVVATDASAAMIAEATQVVAAANLANVRCMVMDAQELEFDASTFDAIVSRNVFMFIPDLALALAGMNRVMKPGARIAATVWGSGSRNPRLSHPLEAAKSLGVNPPRTAMFRIALHLGAPRLVSAALREAGFADVIVERWPVVAHFETVEAAVKVSIDHPGVRELVQLLSGDSEARMRRSLERRWQQYTSASGASLPGEQLVASGARR